MGNRYCKGLIHCECVVEGITTKKPEFNTENSPKKLGGGGGIPKNDRKIDITLIILALQKWPQSQGLVKVLLICGRLEWRLSSFFVQIFFQTFFILNVGQNFTQLVRNLLKLTRFTQAPFLLHLGSKVDSLHPSLSQVNV